MNPRIFPALAILLLALLSACAYTPVAPSNTMQLIYPRLYQEAPLTIMILPPLNQSTAADAKEYFACSLSQAVGQRGYYVMPVEAMFTVLREEGMYDTENITPAVLKNLKEQFGVDAVLYSTIEAWDKSWALVSGSLNITASFALVSTSTSETLWDYRMHTQVELSSNSKKFLEQALEIAFKTAVEDYFLNCLQSNAIAMDTALPYGKHHPQYLQDAGKIIDPYKTGQIHITR